MGPQEIKQRIEQNLSEAKVSLRDLTGTADHWEVTVVSPAFEGKPMLEQHRLVKSFFESEIAAGTVHALSLKTYTPAEWQKFGGR